MTALPDAVLGQLLTAARSHNKWRAEPLPDGTIEALYELVRMGPTSANCAPARFVFVTTGAAKDKLRPHVSAGNVDKVMTAPATVIIGYDLDFARHLPTLFPHNPGAAGWFAAPEVAQVTAFRNATLQGAYLMLAARALGLDCGPMSGFDNGGVDRAFFAGTRIKSNFLCALGYGDPAGLFPRSPRLAFADAVQVL